MVKRSDHSASSTDKEVVADQAAKLKAKDAPLGQLQDVLPGTEIGWVATEAEGAQLPDVGIQPAADAPRATAAVDSDLSVTTDAEVTQSHVDQLEEPVTEAAALTSASSSPVEQVAGASAWLGYGGDEVGAQALAGAAQLGPEGNNFTVTALPSAGNIPTVKVHVGVDDKTPLSPQALSTLTASGDTKGQLREDGQQIASGQLSSAGASGAVSWQVDHSAGLYGQLQLSGDGHWRYTLDNASSRVQGLCVGEQVSEHFIAAVTDSAGRTQFIPLTIAIDGSADRAIISGTDLGPANEDRLLLVSGMLTVQDADAGQAQFKPAVLTGSFGLLTLDAVGHWVYELDNANPAVQALGAGKAATDVLTVTSVDGTTHQVTITVHGSNDEALIVGTHSGALSEDSLLSVQGRLSVTDIDQGEASFVPQTLAGTFGQLQLDTAGYWTYLLDNTNPAVQALGAGAAATDILTVTTLDGTPQQITITIKGSNDAAQIAGALTGAVTEESTLIAKGTLTVTDVDQGQARFNPEVFNGQYGSFSLDATGHWLYVLDNSNAAVQGLAAGEQVRDVITVTSVDGTSCQLVVFVNGSNDAPVLTAQSQTVTEDGARLSGRMVATDVDTGETHAFSTGTAVAGFTLNADGSYSFDPSNAAYQHLAAGQAQDVVIPVIVTDSAGATSTQNLTITVAGTNDAAVVGGRLTNTLTEDSVVSTGGMLRAGGQLSVVDPDAGEAVFVVQAGVTGVGHYGSFSIDASGHYSYIADNTQAAIQRLKAGETLTDRFTVATADGTQQVVTITINGAEDRPVLHAQTHAVTEDGARLTGQMLATDVDAGDTQRFSVAHPVAGFVLNPDGSFSFNPATASYQHLASGQTQDVVIPITVIDSAGGISTQNLTITVTGVNDRATISGVNTGSTAEDNTQAVTGQLTVADVDDGQAHFVAQSGSAGTYGTFALNEQGQWSYSLDNSKASVQALKTGDSVTDSFTVTSADGTTHQVTVTVTGKDDGALIGGADTASVTEDVSVTAGKLEAQGQLTITDPDAGQNHFTAHSNVAGTYGTFSIDQAGHWTYSADNSQGAVQQLKAGDSLIDSMTIASADGTTHTLLVAIQGSNDAPILTAQAQSVTEDGARLTGKMVATDVDQGDTQAFSTQNPPAGFTLNPDGSYSFDPADSAYQPLGLGQPQVISIPVTVTDSTGLISTKNLVITITGSNDAPQLAPSPVKILQGAAPIQGQLTATDPDTGDTLTYRANGPVAGFILNPDGSFSFDPTHAAYNTLGAGQERVVSIPVTVVDGHGGSTTQNLDITVTGTNDGPALTATPQTVKEGDALLQGQLVGTDADSGDTLTYSTTAKPDGFTLNADGSYTFDPAHAAYDDIGLGQTRVLTIPMTVSDGHGGTATQSLQITVIGTNDAPVMVAEPARTTTEDSAILHGQLAATDPDHADTLTYSATATVPGFLINPDGSYTFNPGHGAYNHLAAGQTQVLSIPVEVTDGHGGTGTQTLQISITGADDGPSFVIASTRSATEGGPVLTGQLTATDTDSGDTLTYASGAQVAGFALNADGSYTFDPSHADYDSLGVGHSKTVSVPITVTDSQGQSVTQPLRITIAGSNDNPTVSAVAHSTVAEDSTVLQGRLTIADVDAGDTLTCRTSATVAGFNLNPNGSYTFDPSNHSYDHLAPGDSEVLSIPVTVSDGHGGLASQTLQITITGSNDGPALTVVDQTVSEGTAVLHGQFAGTDPDRGDTLTYSTSATVAGFTLNPDGSYSFDAAHAAYNSLGVGHSQVVSVPITVTDSHGATVTRSLQITIDGTDDVPVLTATPRSVNEGDASIQGRLTATDPDVGDALTYSTTATIAGFRLTPDGSYTFDPSNAAYNSLAAGTSQDVTIPVTVSDGHGGTTIQNLVITVAGVNDAAQISGARTGTVTEDTAATAGKITTTGTLTVTDPDVGQDHFNALVSNGHYGVFTLDAAGQWTYSADNRKPEIQQLKAGATLTDSFTVTSADGTAHTVTVTVAGSNDAPVLQAQTQAVTEDGTQLTGQMVATDVDVGDTKAFSLTNAVDGFTLNADGSYVFDPSHASYQHLAAGQTQDVVIPVTVTDSAGATSTQNLTITVTGTNDTAVIGGRITNFVTEDSVVSAGGMLRAGGQLTVVDPDAGEAVFVAQTSVTGAGHYGSFSIDASGHYSYTADNTQRSIQQLKAGETLTDRFTVATADGTQQVVTITINGAEDKPVLQAQTHAVTEDGARLTGKMLATDVDAGDTQRFSIAHPVAGFVLNPDGSFSFNPATASYQHLAAGQTQDVVIPVTVIDSAGGVSTQNLTITVTGVNDRAVISGVSNGTLTEDQGVSATHTLSCGGKLDVTDVDTGEAAVAVQHGAGANGYGNFVLDPSGIWTYSADNTQSAIQQLKAGETLTDTFTVSSTDGTTHTVTVTIQGTNDAPVLAAQTQAVTEDGTLLQGRMVATDVDANDTQAFSIAQPVDGFTLNTDGSYSFDPSHASYQHLAAGQTQTLTIPVTVTDSEGATSTQNLTIRLTGTNDAPHISGADVGRVIEDQTLSVNGQLQISDADDGQAHFVAQIATAGSYGSLTLSEDGHWQYQLDNSKPEVQALKSTETATDTFTVHSADGSSHSITITIQGQRDNVVIGGVDVGVVKEDVSAVTGGHLVATGESAEFVPLQQRTTLGDFSMDADGAWTYTLDNSRIGTQALKAGETATETVTITHTDGSTRSITISVMGTNDAPVLSAQTQAVTEDGTQLTGHLVATDADHGDTQTFSHANTIDGFTLNADGSYSFDPSHASYQHLATGQTQDLVIPITVTDSTGLSSTQNLTITLTGSNDGATIAGTDSGTVTEDSHIASGKISTSGTLTVIDPDAGQDDFNALVSNGHYGVFTLDAAGQWTYSADNSKPEIQQLKAGATLTDSFTVTSADGTAHTVTVTVAGSNDAPVLQAQTQAVTEAGAQLQGRMVATDVDASDKQVFSTAQVIDGFTLNADGSYSFDPASAAYQHLATGQTQNLVIPITVTDSAGATSTQNLTITITGANDGAVISGVATGTVTEDLTLSVSGQLAITDADDGQAHFVAQTATAGSYGSLTIGEDGQWQYQLDNSKAEVQALKSTETATDTFTVHSADGSSHSITVTIQGQRDSVVIGGIDVGVVKEDASSVTGGHLVATGESAEFVPVSSLRTTLGEFSMDADGAWSYTLDNSATTAQALKDGETTTDTVSITHTDGTTHTITITVMGTNDAPVLAAQTQAVTEDGSQLSGHIVATEVDAGDTQSFSIASAVDGFTLNADGSYQFDPTHASYQHLAAGKTQDVVIPVTVTDSAGATSTQNLTITVTGTNDTAVIGGRIANFVTEDGVVSTAGMLRAGGQLTVVDPDAGEAVFVAQTGVSGAGHYGSFSIDASGHYSYTADNTQNAIQQLKAGETLTDRFTVATADGTQQVVTITIKGAEDKPVLQAQSQAVTEDGSLLRGQMVATDIDAGDTQRFSVAHPVAGFVLNPDGSYTFNPAHAAYQHLAAGQTQDVVIPITVIDSEGGTSTENLTITVAGTNDGPGIASTRASARMVYVDAPSTSISGLLHVRDTDDGDTQTWSVSGGGQGHFGHLDFDAQTGRWTYQLDKSDADTQALKAGEQAQEAFQITVTDGSGASSNTVVRVMVVGTNDAPILTAQSQTVTEDGVQLNGHMVATDVDAGDTQSFSIANAVDGFTLNADGSYSFDPSNGAYQHLAAGQTQDLVIPVTVTDSAGASHTQNLTISITGTNDGAVIGGAFTGAVTEDQSVQSGQLQASGQLTIIDADSGESHFIPQTDVLGSDGLGRFSLDAQGHWSYSADNSQKAIQQLGAGATLSDSFTVQGADGAQHTVTVTLTGTNDAPQFHLQVAPDYHPEVESGDVLPLVINNIGSSRIAQYLDIQQILQGQAPIGAYANTCVTVSLGGLALIGPDGQAAQVFAAGQEFKLQTLVDWQQQGPGHEFRVFGPKGTVGLDLSFHDAGDPNHITGPQGQASLYVNQVSIWPPFHAWQASAGAGTAGDSGLLTATEGGAALSGQFHASDIDVGDTLSYSLGHPVDGFTLNADGSYSFDPSHASYHHLAAGQSETLSIPITVTDSAGASTTQTLSILLRGANDAATFGGVETGTTQEDRSDALSGQLTVADADDGEAHFIAQSGTAGSYGQFSLDENGQWHYQIDNNKPEVQALRDGQNVTDSFTVRSADGTAHTVNISIAGKNDAAIITGEDHQTLTEDQNVSGGQLIAHGQLHASTPDAGGDQFTPLQDLVGKFGHLSLGADGSWVYKVDNNSPAVQALHAGQSATESFTVHSVDGTAHTLSLSIQGADEPRHDIWSSIVSTIKSNWAPYNLIGHAIDAGDVGALGSMRLAFNSGNPSVVDANGHVLASGSSLGAFGHDISLGQVVDLLKSHPGARLVLDGNVGSSSGFYLHDSGDVMELHFRGLSHYNQANSPMGQVPIDGLPTALSAAATVPDVSDSLTISVTDISVDHAGQLQTSGQLSISDADAGENHFNAQKDVAGTYGSFSIDAGGHWVYSVDNGQAAVQNLQAGAQLTDSFMVTSADGTSHVVSVAVYGKNDAPVLFAQSQSVSEDGAQLSGQMQASDVDVGDTLSFRVEQAVAGFTLNADGSYSFDPSNAAYQHLAAGQTETLVIPVFVTDHMGASSVQDLTITVTGANDGPQVVHATAATATAADVGAVNEDTPRVFTEAELLQAVGATDVDDGSSLHIVAGSLTSAHGTFTGDAAHGFTFTPAANFSGQDIDLQFNVTDGTVVREAHAQLDITPVADAPDRVAGKPLDSNFEDAAGSAGWQTSAGGSLPLSGGSPTGGQALALTVGGANHLHQDFDTFAGQRLHLSFDEAGTRGGRFPFEVLWDGKVVATLSPNSAYWTATHHEFDLVATGSNARLEFRSVDGIRGFDGHTDLFDNIKLTFLDARSDREALTNHDLQLQLSKEFRLTDTDGSETLSYLVKGLPVGFTLTDGTHSVTVGSAGQVIETAGWNQGALAVKAPTYFVGTLEIQVSARSEETANQQTATSADIPLRLSFEHLSTPEDTPQTFSEAKLLALADLHAPAGQSYTLSDVQVDPAFGHFTHEANGSWTFTPAANVNADAVPFTLTVSGGAQPISSTLQLAITPVNDAPVLAAQTQAVTEDAALFSGHVLATDPDAGDTQAFSTTATVDGFTLNADGSYQFDPTHASYQHLAAGQTQDLVIPVTVTDHAGTATTQNLTITVTGSNDGPQVTHGTAATAADLGAINEDAPRVFTEAELLQAVGATDADDGSSLHIVVGSLTSAHGTFTGDAAHGFTFTPAANFSGQDVDLQFSVTDGTVVREAHAQLDVTPVADVPVVDLDGVHSGPFKLGWEETPKYTQDIATYAGQTLVLDLAMTNVNQSEYTLGDLEVVWNGQVIATIDRSQHGQAFSYTVTASGESSQLELRAAHPLPEDYHAMWIGLEWIEKVGVTPVHAVAAGHDLSLSSLSPLHNAHLADTDGSETLSYLVKGLSVGFTLTDGTHSVTVGSAGQVIETAGWNQDALAVKAPTDFVGTLEIQVSARSEEAANQQTATSTDIPLRLSFEHLSTPEDTPKTFTESQLLQLAGIHAPAGQAYMLSDVQVDPAFGHFTHDASGSWTFTPAANVNADAVPFTLTVSGGAQPISSQLQLAITPVNDAPLVAHGTAAAAADVGAMTGGTVRVFTESELLLAVGASDVDSTDNLHIVAGSLTSPHGTFTGDAAHGFTFTPAANFSGQDVDLQFRVTDGTASTEAHAQLDVTAVLHAPTVIGLAAVHTDFDSQAVASAGYENVDPARWGWKTDLASGVELGADRLYGAAGSSGNQIVELSADPSHPGNLFRDIATAPGEPLRFAFDLSARPGRPGAAVEVLWEGKVIDTITPGSAGFDLSRHSYDLVATGSQARLELRTQAEDPQHMVLVDNLDLASQRATSINHDLQLNLASNFRLTDTNLPGETLSLLVKGLPVGFVLTDGVHTAAVTSAGQVIDTQGWAVADLAVRAPVDYSGELQIQVSARADDAASHQSAVSAEHLLDLSFERITVAEDTPQTFSAARLLALAGLSAPVGKTYAVDDVQIDPAFGHFTHETNGGWTFTPAANVSDDLIPFKLTVTSGSGLSVHGTLYMTITPVNDAPVLAAQHQAVDAGSSAISGRMLATDEDTGDTQAFSVAHAVDGFTLHADGSYSFDPSHSSYQHIAGGQKQDVVIPITVTDHDGATSMQNLTISVTGVGHAASIGGVMRGDVTEDVNVQGGLLSTSGQLTIRDADAGEDHFIAQNNVEGNGGLGRFSVDAGGHWTYTIRNDWPDVDKLGHNQMMSDTLTVRSADGTSRDITVLIHGSDDTAAFVSHGPTVSNDAYTQIAQALQSRHAVSGFQYLADMLLHQRDPAPFQTAVIAIQHAGVALLGPDGSVAHTYAAVRDVAKVPVAELIAWHAKGAGYQVVLIDATAPQVQVYAHNQGNPGMLMGRYPYTDMLLHPDLNAASFTPQMHVAAIAPTAGSLSATHVALPFDTAHMQEDNDQQIMGLILVQDPDQGQSSMQAMTNHQAAHGSFNIDVNGNWTYQLDTGRPDVQALKDGETLIDTITVHSADGTSHEVNITIHGQNDGAVIAGADTGQVLEDQNVSAAGTIEAHGQLTVTDADAGEAAFVAQNTVATQFGHISIDASGAWRYEVDNNKADVQALKAGESLTEHLTVSSVDGTTHVLTVTVQGSNDAPVLQAQSQSVTEDGSLLRGQMVAQDGDHGDALRFTTHAAVGGFALNADGSYSFDPSHHDYQGLTAGQVLDIDIPIVVSDSAGASSIQMLSLHISGKDDRAFIYGVDSGRVQAGVHPQTSGDLHASDDDIGQSGFQAGMVKGSFGSLTIDAQGHWTYQVDGRDGIVQTLRENSHVNDQVTVHSVDGTAHDVDVEVGGAPAGMQLPPVIQLPASAGGHDVFAGILAAVHAAGYQYQGLADELDKGSLASVGNLDLSITGVHVQVVDKFGQVVQSISPTAENAATLHVSELLLWHAQGHSIVATSDSGLDSTHMWLHNSGDLHNIQVSLPDGTGFNGWVGEYTFGELSLTAQPPALSPAPPAADDFGPQYDDPTPGVDDLQGGTNAAVVVDLNHPVSSADNTHHAAAAPAQGDALNDAGLDVHSAGTTGDAADSYSPVADYLQFAGSAMSSAAMGEHSGTSNTAVHEYLAAAGIDSLTPTADDMHMPPTAVLMDLQHTGVSGEHTAANEQSVDPVADDLAAIENPLADDPNQHHGGI